MAKVRRRSSSALIFLGEYIHVQSDDWHFIFLRGGIAGMSKHCKRVDFKSGNVGFFNSTGWLYAGTLLSVKHLLHADALNT